MAKTVKGVARRTKDDTSYRNYLNTGTYNYTNTARKLDEADSRLYHGPAVKSKPPVRHKEHEMYGKPVKPDRTAKTKSAHRDVHSVRGSRAENDKARSARVKQQKKEDRKSLYEFSPLKTGNASFLTYLIVSVVFIGSVMCCVMFAARSSSLLELNTLKAEHKKLHDGNNNLSNENYEGLNLAELSDLAKRMGMGEPQEHQIVYFDVPKESYVVQYDDEELEKDGFSLDFGAIFNAFLD